METQEKEVICIDNSEALSLTLNTKYKIIGESENKFKIIDDKNKERTYYKSRFIKS